MYHMQYRLTGKDRLVALRIVAIYALVSSLWIYLSDTLLGALVRDPDALVRYSVWKGLAFITATGCLLYYLIARYTRQRLGAEEELKRLNELLELRVAERTDSLRQTYQELEQKTAEQLRGVEELRQKEMLLIQQSRMAAMGEMLVNIAHHWRQPLNVVGLKMQQLALAYEFGEFSKELLDSKVAEAMGILQNLSKSIDEFQAITAPDREKSLFSVSKVISDVLLLTRDGFNAAGVAIEAQCNGEPQINGYANQFTQVLLNILINASDAFREKGAADARILLRSWVEDSRTIVTITDNAGGIREEILERIFDAYFTTKEQGKGTGVGLFMAKTLVEKKMGGRLTVRNVEGGAEFRIEV